VCIENFAMPVVCATTSPDDVLNYLKRNKGVSGLYFLDLDLGCDMDGIRLAEKIRVYDPWGAIVFITADAEAYKLTFEYKIEAMDYIVKDNSIIESRICNCLQNANAKFTNKDAALNDRFIVKINRDASDFLGSFKPSKDSIISMDSKRIMYFETSADIKNSIIIYTTDGSLEFRGSLSKIDKQLDKSRFYRCQRNIIVNLENIVAVDSARLTVLFENGMIVDVSPKQIHKLGQRVRDIMGDKDLESMPGNVR
jgi:two-component system response regulator AgrA